jgi:acyl carrier protein
VPAQSTEETIKEFILREFLPGEDPDALTDGTPLISSGILDSLATLKLVTYLEERFGITVPPNDVEQSLSTIAEIVKLVRSKPGG